MTRLIKTAVLISVITLLATALNKYSELPQDTLDTVQMTMAEKKMEITGDIPEEIMTYCKKTNPDIDKNEAKGLLAQRNYVHKLHKDFEQYQEDIGVMVNVEKNPDKEPIPLQNLSYETQKEYNEKLKKIWDEEIRFLEMRHDKRMISDKNFKEDYKNFKKIRAELDNL